MQIPIGDQLAMSLRKPSIDSRFGPFNSIHEAYLDIEQPIAGMLFGIKENDGTVSLYKWTKDNGTEEDCECIEFYIVEFADIIDEDITPEQSSSVDDADKADVVYSSRNKTFYYRHSQGALVAPSYYASWHNKRRWIGDNLIPYRRVFYYNNSENAFYYYDGTKLKNLSSVNIADTIDEANPSSTEVPSVRSLIEYVISKFAPKTADYVYFSNREDTPDISGGGSVVNADPYGLQLHCSATEGQMRFIKRARQLTDIKFTPAFDMRRVCYQWLGTNKVDIFYKDTEYQGVPYSIISNKYGHSYIAVGVAVSLDTFITATSKAGSWQNTKSPSGNASISGIADSDIDEEYKRGAFYGTFCNAFWAYVYDIKYCYLIFIASTEGFFLESSTKKIGDWTPNNIHEHIRIGDTILNGTFSSGSTTTYSSNPTHVAVITDVWYNEDGTIYAIEISECTTTGRPDYTKKGGKTGGVCRRVTRFIDDFISYYSDYYILHYDDFEHIDYKPEAVSPVGNEGNFITSIYRPLLPESGNKFLYKKSWWNSQSSSTIVLMPTITGTIVVTNLLSGAVAEYPCTANNNVSVTGNEIGTYEAYIKDTDGTNTSKTISCTWRVSDATITAVANSTTSVTFTVVCPDDVDIPFAVSFTTTNTGTNDPYENGKVKCSDGTYIKNTIPVINGNTRTYTFTVKRPSSSYRYAWIVFKTFNFGNWQSNSITI